MRSRRKRPQGRKKIVVVGGGSGTYQVLSGLKKYNIELSAVISMCDSGGSTGRLRKELGILPPGDVRCAILALSDLPFAHKTLEEVFDFRFEKGKNLAGHSVGNILLAALVQITGSMDTAIEEAARILNTSAKVYPVTLDKTNLVAILDDGTKVFGEKDIDMRDFKLNHAISKVYLTPKARVIKNAARVIEKADLVVLGPGDLYTSIIPAVIVGGMEEALIKTKAKVCYVVNLMTKRGETDNFKASDYLEIMRRYLGRSQEKLTHVIVNKNSIKTAGQIGRWYRQYGSKPVVNDLRGRNKVKVISGSFVAKTTFFRHDPELLARAIMKIV